CEGIVALCKTNQAATYAEPIFRVLGRQAAMEPVPGFLDFLRTLQLALIHTEQRPGSIRAIATRLFTVFPHQDARVNRELAILLTYFRREGQLDQPVHRILLTALLNKRDDRPQQIHYFYCLRLLHDGWTTDQKQALLAWYDATSAWEGGHNFSLF